MGDTAGATAGDCVCSEGGFEVAIPGVDPVYRRGCPHDFFLDHAVPQAAVQLGYGQAGSAAADLFIYPNMPLGWPLASTRTR